MKYPKAKEAYNESLNDLPANYRIENHDNVYEIWKYFKENDHSQPHSTFVVGQRRINGDSRHGDRIIPSMT